MVFLYWEQSHHGSYLPPEGNCQLCSMHLTIRLVGPSVDHWGKPMRCTSDITIDSCNALVAKKFTDCCVLLQGFTERVWLVLWPAWTVESSWHTNTLVSCMLCYLGISQLSRLGAGILRIAEKLVNVTFSVDLIDQMSMGRILLLCDHCSFSSGNSTSFYRFQGWVMVGWRSDGVGRMEGAGEALVAFLGCYSPPLGNR